MKYKTDYLLPLLQLFASEYVTPSGTSFTSSKHADSLGSASKLDFVLFTPTKRPGISEHVYDDPSVA